MFPRRFRRFLDDLVEAADVVLAYEAPAAEGAREVADLREHHARRRGGVAARPRERARRPGAAPPGEQPCVSH